MRIGLTIVFGFFLFSCITLPGAKDEQWAYFEDWDNNKNSHLDQAEFVGSYGADDFFEKWAGRKSRISNSELVSKLLEDGDKLTQALVLAHDLNSTASAQKDSLDRPAGNANDLLPVVIDEIDRDDNQVITEEEWANEMFSLADENNDQLLTPIEFYLWQVMRP